MQCRVQPWLGAHACCAGAAPATMPATAALPPPHPSPPPPPTPTQVVCDFCHAHLEHNRAAFESPRLELINDDARAQLEAYPGCFDVIIGDLADPLEGGPCYQLYTQEFYSNVVLPKLNPGGIFITQSGPAGFLSCTEVFTCINATLRSVFPRVLPYTQHMPVFADVWGWNIAFTEPEQADISPEELDARLAARVEGGLRFLDGHTFKGLCYINKVVRTALEQETQVYTNDCGRFIHGHGIRTNGAASGEAAK